MFTEPFHAPARICLLFWKSWHAEIPSKHNLNAFQQVTDDVSYSIKNFTQEFNPALRSASAINSWSDWFNQNQLLAHRREQKNDFRDERESWQSIACKLMCFYSSAANTNRQTQFQYQKFTNNISIVLLFLWKWKCFALKITSFRAKHTDSHSKYVGQPKH